MSRPCPWWEDCTSLRVDLTKPIPIPADTYDFLELSAHAFGGIGAGNAIDIRTALGRPGDVGFQCSVGYLWSERDPAGYAAKEKLDDLHWQYRRKWLAEANDGAVRAINKKKGKTGTALDDKVSFEEYVAELGWERSDKEVDDEWDW